MPSLYEGPPEINDALSAAIALRRAVFYLEDKCHACVKKYKLNHSQYELLETLYHHGALSPMQISKKANLSPASITYLTQKLVGKGLIERRSSVRDGRSIEIELTKAGRRIVKKMLPEYVEMVCGVLGVLDASNQMLLRKMCKRLGQQSSPTTKSPSAEAE